MSWGKDTEMVPHDVQDFVAKLSGALRNKDVMQVKRLYEREYPTLTERLFKASPWPEPKLVGKYANDDETFLVFYKELYYRHLYSHCEQDLTIYARFESYQNYIDLFNQVLGLRTDKPEMELPTSWNWAIIEEFINQFEQFHLYRSAAAQLEDEEIALLQKHVHVWSGASVLRYLHALTKKGGINVLKTKSVEKKSDINVSVMFDHVAHFAIIGLLRVHCLLGNYGTALSVLDHINFKPKGEKNPFQTVISAYVTVYYFMGLSYLMLRRYVDCAKVCQYFINYANRNPDLINRLPKWQGEAVLDLVKRVYALTAISSAISGREVDDNARNGLEEWFTQSHLTGLAAGEEDAFRAMFLKAAPDYVSLAMPNYANKVNTHMDATMNQLKLFLVEVAERNGSQELSSHIKLCKTVPLAKLAVFLKKDEQDVMTYMLNLKHKTHCLQWNDKCSPADGEWASSARVNFYVRDGMVHIVEQSSSSRPHEFFIRQIGRYQDVIGDMQDVRMN